MLVFDLITFVKTITRIHVSILVLVDVGLRQDYFQSREDNTNEVSILVLVDVGLRPYLYSSACLGDSGFQSLF